MVVLEADPTERFVNACYPWSREWSKAARSRTFFDSRAVPCASSLKMEQKTVAYNKNENKFSPESGSHWRHWT